MTNSRFGRQRDAEAAAAAWNNAHTTPAVRAPKLVQAALDSAKSARATPRTRTLLIWGHSDRSSGLDEVRETSLKKPAGSCVHTGQVPETGFFAHGIRARATPAIRPRPVHMAWNGED
jgi:hypothetical protein